VISPDMAATELTVVAGDGARIHVRRLGNPRGPRVMLSHGVGFAIDGFAMMWRHLSAEFDLVLCDLRGHGQNPEGDPASVSGPRIVGDLKDVLGKVRASWGDEPVWGCFHSYSGLTALRLESAEPGWFAGLVLMEPPATRSPDHPAFDAFEKGRVALAERTVKRQASFGSVDELAAKYAGRSQFARFASGAAVELACSLLVPDGTRWRLACTPAFEAAFYASNVDDGLWQRLGRIGCPVMMLAGGDDLKHDVPTATTARDLAHVGGFDFVEVAGTSHMMVLERPHFIAELTRAFIHANHGI
jgi:pimeloyl-ACP methyl ester carboxylesterase